jgi:transposase
LGELADVDLEKLTSQHFWDQMDQVPLETIALIEKDLIQSAIERFQLPLDTLLYDATNFFTFIASTNERPRLPARGHNKQKRHDLRQVGVALLCTRRHGIPLWHSVYGGQMPDAKSFLESFGAVHQRLLELGRDLDALTIVYDKGNVSRANQALVDATFHYVASLTASSQKNLIAEANSKMEPVVIDEGAPDEEDRQVMAYRARRRVFGSERTVVVVLSQRLREGQKRGVLQHVASAQRWLERLSETLRRGKQRRDRGRIQRDIETRLMGRQHLRKVLRVQLQEQDGRLTLTQTFDIAALETLDRDWLGRIVLITDREDWSTADIIRAYRGQSHVEAAFAHLKDPVHLAIRPQFHWTDQKLHVHVFICLVGYLLACLAHLKAIQTINYSFGMERLIEDLEQVRRVTLLRQAESGKGRLRTSTQLEYPPHLGSLIAALGVTT